MASPKTFPLFSLLFSIVYALLFSKTFLLFSKTFLLLSKIFLLFLKIIPIVIGKGSHCLRAKVFYCLHSIVFGKPSLLLLEKVPIVLKTIPIVLKNVDLALFQKVSA